MNIRVTRPTTFKVGNKVVAVTPHHVVRLPDAIAKTLMAKAPQIRRARVKG